MLSLCNNFILFYYLISLEPYRHNFHLVCNLLVQNLLVCPCIHRPSSSILSHAEDCKSGYIRFQSADCSICVVHTFEEKNIFKVWMQESNDTGLYPLLPGLPACLCLTQHHPSLPLLRGSGRYIIRCCVGSYLQAPYHTDIVPI